MQFKVIDTFAGAGGFSLGFHLAGCVIEGAVESDKWAAETFAFNHPNAKVLVRDIEGITESELLATYPQTQNRILLGGPPCQGFSVCRRTSAGDSHDPRNSLFKEFLRFAAILNPSVLIMENVPNLMGAKTREKRFVLDIITSELQSLGYDVHAKILHATDFGVPQIRKRLFVLGTKTKLLKPFPEPTHSVESTGQPKLFTSPLIATPTLWDAISDLPKLGAGEGTETMEYLNAPLNDYQDALRTGSTRLYNHAAMKHTRRIVERFASMQWGESVSDVPRHLKPFARSSNGAVSTKAYDQNNRRMHPDRPCHTVPASFYANFVHPYDNRNFTAREGARIQSFPDWYVFKGKPTVVSHMLLAREGRHDEKYLCQYSQIGNAVPPLLAKAIAQHVITYLREENRERAWKQPVAERSRAGQI